ncbi:MAG TPA: hypothetical protein VFI40_00540 [Nocardioides sp.]|nr:hypothetical protein [Nocardioides sp.]
MSRRRQPVVPVLLVDQIEEALSAVDGARAELAHVIAERAPLRERREAHARVRHSFDAADALLRQATGLAKQRSYWDWSLWRHRLSSLDTARQIHLFAEQDDFGVLPIGSVRAIDTGMSGPDLGDLQHGKSRASGTLPAYGLDLEALLVATTADRPTAADPRKQPASEPVERQPCNEMSPRPESPKTA